MLIRPHVINLFFQQKYTTGANQGQNCQIMLNPVLRWNACLPKVTHLRGNLSPRGARVKQALLPRSEYTYSHKSCGKTPIVSVFSNQMKGVWVGFLGQVCEFTTRNRSQCLLRAFLHAPQLHQEQQHHHNDRHQQSRAPKYAPEKGWVGWVLNSTFFLFDAPPLKGK